MFSVGDLVVYGVHGVCRITDLEKRIVDRRQLEYLVLQPADGTDSRYFVPTHNEAALKKLQPVLSRQALEEILHSSKVRENVWIEDENQRKLRYRELITGSDRVALLQMVRCLHIHKQQIEVAGRKFHLCDENFLRDAERLLSSEFALVLDIEPQQVAGYVLSALEEN